MDITIDNLTIKTVPQDYSWDKLNPTESTVVDAVLSGDRFIGYAPFVSALLNTWVSDLSGKAIGFISTAEYGDYYNSETSTQTSLVSGEQTFCHNYIMPGVYTLVYNQAQYTPTDTSQCSDNTFNPYDTYVEKDDLRPERLPFSWMWYNFFKEDYDPRTELVGSFEPRTEFLTWDDCVFQGPKQITWNQASGPALEIRSAPISWQWKKIKPIPEPYELYSHNTNWAQTTPTATFPRTWKQIKQYKCSASSSSKRVQCLELVPKLSATTFTKTLTSFLEVIELPPKASIEIIHTKTTNDRVSPYTVTLSPKYVRCGSFPIEKLVWDLGDGSPVIEINRSNVNQITTQMTNARFVFNGNFESDFFDPRNYDITYTYNRKSTDNNCFYPSLTAFAGSTGTYDCTSSIIGPIKLQSHNSSKFSLVQNYLSESGIAYSGTIGTDSVFWNRNK